MGNLKNIIFGMAFSGLSAATESDAFSKKVRNPKIRAITEEIIMAAGFILKAAGWIITIAGILGAGLSIFGILVLKYSPDVMEFLNIIESADNGDKIIREFHATLNRVLFSSIGLLLLRLFFVFFPRKKSKKKLNVAAENEALRRPVRADDLTGSE